MECASCGADIDAIDRYCPACRLPNVQGSRHPRFGPAERDPGPAIAPRVAAEGERPCPRCRSGLRSRDHYCRSCGLDVSRLAPPPPISRTAGVWMTPGPITVDSYRPLGRLSMILKVMILLITVAAVVTVGISLLLWRTLSDGSTLAAGFPSVDAGWVVLDQWVHRLAMAQAALLTVAALLTIAWSRRGYRNLGCLGVSGRRHAAFWATWGWLIPGANLIIPKLIVDDTWRASDPELESGSAQWRSAVVPTANHMWWISTIVALPTVALALAAILSTGDQPVDLAEVHATQGSLLVLAVAEMLVVFAAILFARTITGVTERQRARAERLGPAARPSMRPPVVDEPPAPIVPTSKGPVLLHSTGAGASAGRY
ncbi:MAG: DUF4328 domain-containing protein [Acidimicrobiales bacterium]